MHSPFFARLAAKLFARPTARTAHRLGMEQLEDRVVPTGSFGGRVWLDENANGVQDGTEPGVPNVTVRALDNMWNPVASDVTDAFGDYVVEGVPDDSYNSTYLLPEGSPYHFGYYGSGVQAIYYPTGVGGTIAIPVYEPPEVSVVALGEAVEGEVAGAFRFTRTGDLSTSLTVEYEVVTGPSNYATNGDDVVTLSGTVTIPAWSEFWDVPVEAWADNDYDPDETLNISVLARPHYVPGLLAMAGMAVVDTSFVVTTTADSITVADNRVSLREAILVANRAPRVSDRIITFNFPGTSGTIHLVGTLPAITKNVYIAGPGNRGVTITSEPVRHLEVAPEGNVIIAGIKFLDGFAVDGAGGSILSQGNLTIANCEFRNNRAITRGGAIAAISTGDEQDVSLTITGSDIVGNFALEHGGGVYVEGVPLTIASSTIGLNVAVLGGGGIAIDVAGPDTSSIVTLSGVQVLGNMARDGGGIFVYYAELNLDDGTNIEGNVAGNHGGGVYAEGSCIDIGEGNGARFASNQAVTGWAIFMDEESWMEGPLPLRTGGDERLGGIAGGMV